MKHCSKKRERGFALIIVVMIVAAISIVAVTLLNFVNLDIVIAGQHKRTFEASSVADSAAMEMLDHADLPNRLPDFSAANLQTVLSDPNGIWGAPGVRPAGTSMMIEPNGTEEMPPMDFTADVRLLRYVPIAESSLNWSRALFFEVYALGEVAGGESTREVRSEFSTIVSYAPGTLLPRMHGR